MNIFITGIAGFLGRHIAKKLVSNGHNVSGNDSLIGGDIQNIPSGCNFYEINCCDFNQMSKSLKDIDIVYHCAATAHEGLSVFSPSFITRNIFEASVTTFSAAASNSVKKIIFCSSMARYGNQKTPFTEDMDPMPVDPYGVSKVAAEEVLKILSSVHNFDYTIAVPHNIVGPYQKYDDPFRNVMSIMLNRLMQNKPAIIYGDGTQTRCFSYIDDCIQCLEKMAFDQSTNSEIINIGPDEETITIKELADLCSNVVGTNKPHEYYSEGRPTEVKHATCSSNKARRILNYKTSTGIKEAILKTYNFIKQKGPKEFKYNYDLEIINNKTPKTWTEKKI